jgi:transposase
LTGEEEAGIDDFSATTSDTARAYSDDLRGKILRAYERGRLGLEGVAEQFGVSYGYAKKIRRQQLQSGQVERPRQSRHQRSAG